MVGRIIIGDRGRAEKFLTDPESIKNKSEAVYDANSNE